MTQSPSQNAEEMARIQLIGVRTFSGVVPGLHRSHNQDRDVRSSFLRERRPIEGPFCEDLVSWHGAPKTPTLRSDRFGMFCHVMFLSSLDLPVVVRSEEKRLPVDQNRACDRLDVIATFFYDRHHTTVAICRSSGEKNQQQNGKNDCINTLFLAAVMNEQLKHYQNASFPRTIGNLQGENCNEYARWMDVQQTCCCFESRAPRVESQ